MGGGEGVLPPAGSRFAADHLDGGLDAQVSGEAGAPVERGEHWVGGLDGPAEERFELGAPFFDGEDGAQEWVVVAGYASDATLSAFLVGLVLRDGPLDASSTIFRWRQSRWVSSDARKRPSSDRR